MSGDTPTARFGMKLHSLHCPECSNDVFAREADLFGDGESEHCAACGSLVTISTDGESPVDVRVDEHGGAVVARLLAEAQDARHAMRLARIDRAAAQSPRRAQAIIAAWVREGEAGNNIDEARGVCLMGVDLEAIHKGGTIVHRTEVERLTQEHGESLGTIASLELELEQERQAAAGFEAEAERLTAALRTQAAIWQGVADEQEAEVERLASEQVTQERDEARREVCRHRARTGRQALEGSRLEIATRPTRAMAIAAELGWSCFVGGGS